MKKNLKKKEKEKEKEVPSVESKRSNSSPVHSEDVREDASRAHSRKTSPVQGKEKETKPQAKTASGIIKGTSLLRKSQKNINLRSCILFGKWLQLFMFDDFAEM